MKSTRRWRYLLEYLAFRLIVCLVAALPTIWCVRLCEALAWVVHRLLPRKLTRYHVARENLQLASGGRLADEKIDRTIYRMWVHLFRMVTEIVQMPRKLRLYNCADVIEFRNRDETVRAMCAGRPVIVLSGHFGNWEIANATFGIFGFPAGAVARDLDNPWLHDWFSSFRQGTGGRLISKRGGSADMLQYMTHRGAIGLLADQDAGPRGLFVPFFGRPASTFKSIALLALEYRAVICVGYARRLPDDFDHCRWVRYELGSEEIIDSLKTETNDPVRELTERFTAALERAIRRSPEQYFWVHRRWKHQPQQRARRKQAA